MVRRLGLERTEPKRQGFLGSIYLEVWVNEILGDQTCRITGDEPSAESTASG